MAGGSLIGCDERHARLLQRLLCRSDVDFIFGRGTLENRTLKVGISGLMR